LQQSSNNVRRQLTRSVNCDELVGEKGVEIRGEGVMQGLVLHGRERALVPQVVGLFEPFPKIAGPDLNATRASEDRVGDLVEGDPHLRCVGGELLSAGRTLAKEGARLWDALIVLDLELADDAKDRGVPIGFRVRAVNPADSRHGKVMLRIIERAV